MEIPLLNFSSLLKSQLLDRAGEKLGRVDDLIVRLGDPYPPITGLKARIGGRELFVPADQISEIAPGRVRLRGEQLNLGRFERREGEVLLREDILYRRMINVVGARLVRANDLVIGRVEGWWRVVGVDAGLRGFFRRLLPALVAKRVTVRPFLDWASVEPFVGHVPTARLRMPFAKLSKLHPAQIADLVEAASHEEGEEIIATVGADREFEADVFEELDPEHQVEFLRERPDSEAAGVLAKMEADDAADLIGELDQERREGLLRLLPWQLQRKLRALLGYNPATAGGLMSPDFIAAAADHTVADALELVRSAELPEETITTVFVLGRDRHLLGVTSVVALVKHLPETPLTEIAVSEPVVLEPDEDLSEVAVKMADYDLTVAPVVDDQGQMLGVVSVDDLLELMIPDDWRRRLTALSNE